MRAPALALAFLLVGCGADPAACSAFGSGALGASSSSGASCGNGKVETGEACDDSNTTNGDGCSSTCTVESGYVCTGSPSACAGGAVLNADFTQSTSRLPACTSGNSCVMQCFSDGVAPWKCVDASGNTIAVTQGTGTTSETTPWGTALTDVTVAKSPTLTSPAFMESFWTTPHTVVIVGHVTGRTDPTTQVLLSHSPAAGTSGFYMYNSGTSFACQWGSVASITQINGPLQGGIAAYACIKSGTGAGSSYKVWSYSGSNSTSVAADPTAPTGATFRFGAPTTTGLAGKDMRGPLISATFYSVAKSTTVDMPAIENQVAGINVAGFTRGATTGPLFFAGSDGQYWPTALPRVDSAGLWLESEAGLGGGWATDALDASSWTDVGTPIVTTNQDSGPFSSWKGGAEADLITDDDAAVFEGKESPVNGGSTYTGQLTISCFLKQGTSGTTTTKARLQIVTDGTGGTTCDKTLTSSYARYSCTTTIGGSPTSTKGRLLVGNATSDTGSILVSQCQTDRHGWATAAPKVDNSTSIGIAPPVISTATTATFPHDADDGEIEFVWNLDHSIPGDETAAEGGTALWDVADSTETDHRLLDERLISGISRGFYTRGATGDIGAAIVSSPTSLANTDYVSRYVWQHLVSGRTVNRFFYNDVCTTTAYNCRATTLVAQTIDGTAAAPIAPFGTMHLGARYNNIYFVYGHIKRIAVKRVPR